ncbi:UNKNOWN [Stylonychia lemnae]|uniref:Cell differentiation protein rcd1 n=1 Tax=Stylonychia lemnae TaxID=5949 RepID=A0A078B1S6_STYLE|nr:UNKNOWN [Stylonychia lemnae]|eukprot:CDW88454.1 UNKNOWN [Stylonychia lemnae]
MSINFQEQSNITKTFKPEDLQDIQEQFSYFKQFVPYSQQDIPQSFITSSNISEEDKLQIIKQIDQLKFSEKRDDALIELSRQREHFTELAPYIWNTVGTIAALLQEIIAVYPLLSPPNLDTKTSNKACNVLALLQSVASHKETKSLFLKAHIPLFLYPFLNTVSKGRPFEYLRLTSLGVIGALVKVDDPEVINFLLQTEIIPLCLRIMERGTELSQTVATFIIQKILFDDQGLNYLCQTAERFFAVSTVLNNMVISQHDKPSQRLFKHILRCYSRLGENIKARKALRENIPQIIKDSNILTQLDESTRKGIKSLSDSLFSTQLEESLAGQDPYQTYQSQTFQFAQQQKQGTSQIDFTQAFNIQGLAQNSQNVKVQIINRPMSSHDQIVQNQQQQQQQQVPMTYPQTPPIQMQQQMQQQQKLVQPIPVQQHNPMHMVNQQYAMNQMQYRRVVNQTTPTQQPMFMNYQPSPIMQNQFQSMNNVNQGSQFQKQGDKNQQQQQQNQPQSQKTTNFKALGNLRQ